MSRLRLRALLVIAVVVAGLSTTFAAALDGPAEPPSDELAPQLAAPFRLAIHDLAWNRDPHAMPHGRAVLEADGRVIWEVADVSRAAASEDGGSIALLTRDYHILVSRLPEKPRPLDSREYLSPRLSSDGRLLVAQRLGDGRHILEKTVNTLGIALVDLMSGESRLILEGNDLHSPSFASDSMIFFGSGGEEGIASLYLLDLASLRVARATNREKDALTSDFGPLHRFDGRKAVLADVPIQTGVATLRMRRPNVQVKQPKVYQYYDLDRRTGNTLDWGCFQTTYDQHLGTDFNQSYGYDVVAPASGAVIYRYDGCDDTNSPGCGMGLGNHVAIQHTDGSVSALAHGKKGTVVGFGAYACGAVLMQSANSGNSNAYHIHHETWTKAPQGYAAPKFDPFQGSCGPSDPSKWSIQNPYGDLPGTTCTN